MKHCSWKIGISRKALLRECSVLDGTRCAKSEPFSDSKVLLHSGGKGVRTQLLFCKQWLGRSWGLFIFFFLQISYKRRKLSFAGVQVWEAGRSAPEKGGTKLHGCREEQEKSTNYLLLSSSFMFFVAFLMHYKYLKSYKCKKMVKCGDGGFPGCATRSGFTGIS